MKTYAVALGGLLAAFAALFAIIDGLGLGSSVDVLRPEPSSVSYRVTRIDNPCVSGPVFVPAASARTLLAQPPPDLLDELFDLPGSAFVDRVGVEISIRGTSRKAITLTGIEFSVDHQRGPAPGISIHGQCGDASFAQLLEYDLDTNPPRLVKAEWDVPGLATRSFRFPWEVSLDDPLQLMLFARADACTCAWTAEIEWQSGSERGTIPIDHEGEQLRIVSPEPSRSYLALPSDEKWEPLGQL